jgi:drug/metabolite transporter (DMT)-like permease
MTPWKKFVGVNVGMLIGIGISLFIVPPNTPFWLWAVIAAVFLAGMNYYLYRKLQKPPTESKSANLNTIIIVIGSIIFLADIAYRYFHR